MAWYERLEQLRTDAESAPHATGMEALLILEDWLYERAKEEGYPRDHGSMRDYLNYIEKRRRLTRAEGARIERFIEVRNCLSHRSGLLMSAALTEELLDFLERLFRRGATTAQELMTPRPYTVRPTDNLYKARDWMLENSISRLPVVNNRGVVVGLLTNRDLVIAEASRDPNGNDSAMTVERAVHADSLEQILFMAKTVSYDEVLGALQEPHVAAIFVTGDGKAESKLLGLITVTDILPKL